jgi:hypothetical protein
MPAVAPEIRLVSNEKLKATICPACKNLGAGFMDGVIYIDETLDMSNVRTASILFHEMVHFLQWSNKGPAKNCDEWFDREVVAYQLQNEVLFKAGVRLVQVPYDLRKYCKEEQK